MKIKERNKETITMILILTLPPQSHPKSKEIQERERSLSKLSILK